MIKSSSSSRLMSRSKKRERQNVISSTSDVAGSESPDLNASTSKIVLPPAVAKDMSKRKQNKGEDDEGSDSDVVGLSRLSRSSI